MATASTQRNTGNGNELFRCNTLELCTQKYALHLPTLTHNPHHSGYNRTIAVDGPTANTIENIIICSRLAIPSHCFSTIRNFGCHAFAACLLFFFFTVPEWFVRATISLSASTTRRFASRLAGCCVGLFTFVIIRNWNLWLNSRVFDDRVHQRRTLR